MHYRIGRFFQVLGMIVLPFGIASELMGKVGLGQSMLDRGGGNSIFYIGYVIQNQSVMRARNAHLPGRRRLAVGNRAGSRTLVLDELLTSDRGLPTIGRKPRARCNALSLRQRADGAQSRGIPSSFARS